MRLLARTLFIAVGFALTGSFATAQKLPEGTKAEKNIAYGKHERNKLDIYLPTAEKPLPLIVWVHGGAWLAGSKDGGNPAMKLLEKGYAVAAINYRYSTQAVFPAQIEDCQAAVRYLRANAKKYNLNPDAFGAFGLSAGGHLVALMGTAGDAKEFADSGNVREGSSKVQAVCDWYGPTDMTKMSLNGDDSPLVKLFGGKPAEKAKLVAAANPMTHISKTTPPFLIMHGDKDPLVPVSQSEMLHDALKKADRDSTLVVVPGAGHDGKVGAGEYGEKIAAFFDKHLKK